MAIQQKLNERQKDVLRWVVAGCPDRDWPDESHKHTARALQSRRLARVSRMGGRWHATATEAGAFYAEHDAYPPGHWGGTPASADDVRRTVRQRKRMSAEPSPTGRVAARALVERLVENEGSLAIADEEVGTYRKTAQSARSTPGLVPQGKVLYVVRRVVERRHQWLAVLEDLPAPAVVAPTIRVSASLSKPHPAVQRLRDNKHALQFSAPARMRALRCLDALVKEATRRGYGVDFNDHTVTIRVRGESFELGFSEQNVRTAHEPTAAEIRKQEQYSWNRPPQWDYTPTGRLNFRIGYHKQGEPKPRKDGSVAWRLEDRMGEALAYVEARAQESEERAKRRQEEAEERRRQYELDVQCATRSWAEHIRATTLLNRARAWREHQLMTTYLLELSEAVASGSDEGREAAVDWLEWASNYLVENPALGSVAMPTIPKPSAQDLAQFMPRQQANSYGS